MFLSEFKSDLPSLYKAEVKDDYSLHQFVYKFFPKEKDRCFLYYPDLSKHGQISILIQSSVKPIDIGFGQLLIKEVEQTWYCKGLYSFKIRIVPLARHEGRCLRVLRDEDAIDWLCKRVYCRGGNVYRNTVISVGNGQLKCRRAERKITISYVDLVGVLKIEDELSFFKQLVCSGLGQGKGFGCGLMQLQKIEQ